MWLMSLVQLLGWKFARGGGEVGWVLEPESSPGMEEIVRTANSIKIEISKETLSTVKTDQRAYLS